MKDAKTLWFYIFSLAGLMIVSILFTSRIESPEVEPLPALATLTVTTVRPTPTLAKMDQKACSATARKVIAGYLPEMARLKSDHLVISGTVYAADFVTPLPGARIGMWQASREREYIYRFPPYYDFHDWFLTDTNGHYEFTLQQPSLYDVIHLHYKASDQDNCPFVLRLLFVDEAVQADTSPTLFPLLKQVPHAPLPTSSSMLMELGLAREAGSVLLQGPVDVVLPVSPGY